VITFLGIPALEYFGCRYAKGQISWFKHILGLTVIKILLMINGRLVSACLSAGPYLHAVAKKDCPKSRIAEFFGVNTERFRPTTREDKNALREKWNLPTDKFIIFLSSRMTHEKDPETVLKSVYEIRKRGIDAILINLSGDYEKFIHAANSFGLEDSKDWIIGKPAVHPIYDVPDFFRLADAVTMASLQEGACLSTLESLASGTPLVATSVGGMEIQLKGYARLTPRQDAKAMADELEWISKNYDDAVKQALQGRKYVQEDWNEE